MTKLGCFLLVAFVFILTISNKNNAVMANDEYVADLKIFLDSSVSIHDESLEEIKQILLKITNRLHPQNKMAVQLTWFSKRPSRYTIDPYHTKSNITDLRQAIDDVIITEIGSEGTPIIDALKLLRFSGDKGARVVLIFSDGYFASKDIPQIENEIANLKSFNPDIFVLTRNDMYDHKMLGKFCHPDIVDHFMPMNEYRKIFDYMNDITVANRNLNMFAYRDYI